MYFFKVKYTANISVLHLCISSCSTEIHEKIHRCKAGFRYLCLMNFLNTNQNKQESEHLKIFNWCRFKIKNFIIFNLKIHKWLRTN